MCFCHVYGFQAVQSGDRVKKSEFWSRIGLSFTRKLISGMKN